MRRGWIPLLVIVTVVAALWWSPTLAPTYTLAYNELAQTFTALKTFSAGVKAHSYQDATASTGEQHTFTDATFTGSLGAAALPLASYSVALALSTPTTTPTPTGITGIGSCSNSVTYRLYATWANQSGETLVSPASSDFTPASSSKQIVVSQPSGIPPLVNSWRVFYSKSTESHSTLRQCQSTATYLASGTATMNCTCSSIGPSPPVSNNSGTEDLFVVRDGELRSILAGASPQYLFTPSRLSMTSTVPRWSIDDGVTSSAIMVTGPNMKYVCKAGCEYSTVTTALAAISDNSSTKRWTVLIYPGDYDETPAAKSYVSLIGIDRATTRIRGAGAAAAGITIPIDGTEIGISNLTIGGNGVKTADNNTVRTNIYVWNCIVGITDGTENTPNPGPSVDNFILYHKVNVYSIGNICRSLFDSVIVANDASYYGSGNQYFNDNLSVDNQQRLWSVAGPGALIYEESPIAIITNTTNNQAMEGFTRSSAIASGTTSRGESVVIRGGTLRMSSTNASRTARTTCFNLPNSQPTNAVASSYDFSGTDCEISVAGSSVAVKALEVAADADHANVSVLWNSGRSVLSGGASQTDIDNAETVGGFSLTIAGVLHGGTYTGAGTVTAGDARIGAFTTRLLTRVGDLVAATCTNNEIALDTGGANNEICICTGGAWSCATVTTATGPTN